MEELSEYLAGPKFRDSVKSDCSKLNECDVSCLQGHLDTSEWGGSISCILHPEDDNWYWNLPTTQGQIICADIACDSGFIDDQDPNFYMDEGASIECIDDSCNISCDEMAPNSNFETVSCDNFAEIKTKGIECNELTCGGIEDIIESWDNGPDFNLTCTPELNECDIICNDPALDASHDKVTCSNGIIFPKNPSCSNEDDDSPTCGNVADQYHGVNAYIEWSCEENICTASCPIEYHPKHSQAVFSIDNKYVICDEDTGKFTAPSNLIVQCEVLDVTCGNLADFYSFSKDITYDCSYYGDGRVNWDVCILQCPAEDQQRYPTFIDTIYCDQDTGEWETPGSSNYQKESGVHIDCAETKCGNSADWNFGSEYQNIDRTCEYDQITDSSICQLNCQLGTANGFVVDTAGNGIDDIVCDSDRELTPEEDLELVCAETPCGKLDLTVNINSGNIISTCDTDGCDFSCSDDSKIPSYKRLDCNNAKYDLKWGMKDGNEFTCVVDRDTPCGDVSDYFNLDDTVEIECDPFESIYQTSSFYCIASCKSDNDILIGDSELKCKNGKFQNKEKNLGCSPTACGNPVDHYTIKNLGTDIMYTCDNNVCSFSCTDPTHSPLITSLTCNKWTGKFIDIILFPDSDYPLQISSDTVIDCKPQQPTYCGDPDNVFDNINADTTVFNCDYDTGVCDVECKPDQSEHAQTTINEVVCNAKTGSWVEDLETNIDCVLYDSTCGQLSQAYTLSDDITYECNYYEERGLKLDICTLSCPEGTIPVNSETRDPINELKCNQKNGKWHQDTGLSIECIPPPETNCGYLDDYYTISDDVIRNCNYENGKCYFSCPVSTDYIQLSVVQCHKKNGYTPKQGNIECLSGYDTACGNVDADEITSVKSCTDNVCVFGCADPAKFIKGITKATCTVTEGVKNFEYEYVLPGGVNSKDVGYSTCGDTMCGNYNDIPITVDFTSVSMDTSAVNGQGFGTVSFNCNQEGVVVSGLRGRSEIGCPVTTGIWDTGVPDGAAVECSKTTCGDPEDVLGLGDDISYTCADEICSFSCNSTDVQPTLSKVVCNTATGKFLTGISQSVKCAAGCAEFGPESGFTLDENLLMFCEEFNFEEADSQKCDLFCRGDDRPAPVVEKTLQELKEVVCHKVNNK